jgi:hypothetical protein
MNSGNSFNNNFKSSGKKAQKKSPSKKKGGYKRRNSDEDLDSHTESDEAVDDKGALF